MILLAICVINSNNAVINSWWRAFCWKTSMQTQLQIMQQLSTVQLITEIRRENVIGRYLSRYYCQWNVLVITMWLIKKHCMTLFHRSGEISVSIKVAIVIKKLCQSLSCFTIFKHVKAFSRDVIPWTSTTTWFIYMYCRFENIKFVGKEKENRGTEMNGQ